MRPTLVFVTALAVALITTAPAFAEADKVDCSVSVEDYKPILSHGCQDELDKAPNDAARANLLFRLAYVLNDNEKAVAALSLLDRAVELDPDNARYIGERGFTRGDLGFYRDALEDLNMAVALKPDSPAFLSERGWVLEQLGDFTGAESDYNKQIALEGESDGALLPRARTYVWLGRLDEAEADLAKLEGLANWADAVARLREQVARIRNFKPDKNPAEECDLKEGLSDKSKASRLFDACTRAFLDASENAKKAEFLTYRATARIVMEQSYDDAMQDYKVATGLDPDDPNRHINFGFALLQGRHSWAARNEFDAALKLGPSDATRKALALAGRAQANYNLQDPDAAFTDAKASFEVAATPVALDVLGDLAFDKGDKDVAKSFWMGEYHMGIRDDGLMERLKSVGVSDPASEPEPKD